MHLVEEWLRTSMNTLLPVDFAIDTPVHFAKSGLQNDRSHWLQSTGAYFAGFAGCSQTPFRQKKKKKKGRCASTAAATRTLGAWNWGVVPQYPPCPHKRFRRVSWQIGQFSAANLVSLRSWEAELLSVRQDVQETANSPTVHLWVVCSSCKAAHNLARRWPAKRGGCLRVGSCWVFIADTFFSHHTSSQCCKARRFGQVAPAIFK